MITKAEFIAKRKVSETLTDKEFADILDSAEFSELRPFLGEELYTDIVNDPSLTTRGDYPKLLEGGSYQYGGDYYNFPGLKEITLDYCYAYYLLDGDAIETPTGTRQFDMDKFARLKDYDKSNKAERARKKAFYRWEITKDFLNRSSFTYWYGEGHKPNTGTKKINIQTVTLA